MDSRFLSSGNRRNSSLLVRSPGKGDLLFRGDLPDWHNNASLSGTDAGDPIAYVDTELGAKDLLNNRMAYVAVSRGAYDAQIFTNDREKLGAALGHDESHSSAHAPEMKPEQKQEQAVTPQREIAQKQEQGEDFGLELSL